MSMVRARSGAMIDTTGDVWDVGGGFRLDFRPLFQRREDIEREWPLIDALVDHMTNSVAELTAITVARDFSVLAQALKSDDVIRAFDAPGVGFLMAAYRHFRKTSSHDSAKARAGICRRWYVSASDMGHDAFDADKAIAMEALSIGRTNTGVAVRRLDPHKGPLPQVDRAALENALWDAFRLRELPVSKVAAGLIYLLLGPNVGNVRWLNENDLASCADPDGNRALMMPRIKRRHGRPRVEFKRRLLSADLAAVLDAVIEDNARSDPQQDGDNPTMRAMFLAPRAKAATGRPSRAGNAWHYNCVADLPRQLGLKASAGGELRLHPRRLRYSFAMQAVVEDRVPPDVLADLLDHSSLATELVYYDPRLDLVKALDRALAAPMQRLADIALGRTSAPLLANLADVEAEVARAPLACFACRRFRPVSLGAVTHAAARVEELRSFVEGEAAGKRTERQTKIAAYLERIASGAAVSSAALSELAECRDV